MVQGEWSWGLRSLVPRLSMVVTLSWHCCGDRESTPAICVQGTRARKGGRQGWADAAAQATAATFTAAERRFPGGDPASDLQVCSHRFGFYSNFSCASSSCGSLSGPREAEGPSTARTTKNASVTPSTQGTPEPSPRPGKSLSPLSFRSLCFLSTPHPTHGEVLVSGGLNQPKNLSRACLGGLGESFPWEGILGLGDAGKGILQVGPRTCVCLPSSPHRLRAKALVTHSTPLTQATGSYIQPGILCPPPRHTYPPGQLSLNILLACSCLFLLVFMHLLCSPSAHPLPQGHLIFSAPFLCMRAESAPSSWGPRLCQGAPSSNHSSSLPASTISQQPSGLDAFIIPILQMRKLRPRMVNLFKEPPASKCWGWDANPSPCRPSDCRVGFTLLCCLWESLARVGLCAGARMPLGGGPLMTSVHA